jgi:hypothetical protein
MQLLLKGTATMPAPKGNKFAAKENPKNRRFTMVLRPEAMDILKNMAVTDKISMAQVVEKALLAAYPQKFDGLF